MSGWFADLWSSRAHLCGLKQQLGPNHLFVTCYPVPRCQVSLAAVPVGATHCCLLLEAAAPRACVSITLTRQQRFDQALMQVAHGVARCLTIACQWLPEQRNEPLSEDSLVATYTLGRHFANNMRVPMQDSSELLMCRSPFIPEVPDNHPGHLNAALWVVDNAWRDDGGLEMLNELVVETEEAGVRPAYTQHLSPHGHPGGDPNDSTSSAIAQGLGAPVLIAADHPSSESVNPTLSSSTQGHGPPGGRRCTVSMCLV